MNDTLDELRNCIRWEATYVGRNPHSHEVVRILLVEIETRYGRAEADRAVRDFGLEIKGFNTEIIDGDQP